jgi:cytosine/adenosine deaminase-related metal-dependent hydrolase
MRIRGGRILVGGELVDPDLVVEVERIAAIVGRDEPVADARELDAVELLAEAPARILGIYPRKGALLPGSDADLVFADLGRKVTLTDEGLYTKVGWTPYLG